MKNKAKLHKNLGDLTTKKRQKFQKKWRIRLR